MPVPKLNLEPLFHPKAIAVVGASATAGRFSNTPLANLRQFGFGGSVYPISTRAAEVEGWKAFPSVLDLPETPDHAVITLRPDLVLGALEDCVRCGIPAMTIVASGFTETGTAEGTRIQEEIRSIAANNNLALCGPNTLGVANFNEKSVSIATTNLPETMKGGDVAIISQSGGCGFTILNRAWYAGVGIGYIAVAGNETGITIPDYIEHFVRDPSVKVILCYFEAMRHPAKFLESAALARSLGKPIVVMRAGVTEVGLRAAAAHTGALAGVNKVMDAVLQQYGIVQVSSFDALVAAGGMFSRFGVAKGRRVGVYAQGGGMAVVMADKFTAAGLELPPPLEATRERIHALLSDTSPGNPFDSGGQFLSTGPDALVQALELFASDDNYDIIAYSAFPSTGERERTYCDSIAKAAERTSKPAIVLQYRAGSMTRYSEEMFRNRGILAVDHPEAAIEALSGWTKFGEQVLEGTRTVIAAAAPKTARDGVWQRLAELRRQGSKAVLEHEAKQMLAAYGLRVPREHVVLTAAEAARAAADIGFPVVAKLLSPDLTHRAGTRTIELGLGSQVAASRAFRSILNNARRSVRGLRFEGILIQEQAKSELELFAGVQVDSLFGPTVMLGIGGIFVEALNDVSFRLPPLDIAMVNAMIEELKGSRLLNGYRGTPAVDRRALAEILVPLGTFAQDMRDHIEAIDLNPLIVQPGGKAIGIVDALFVLRPAGAPASTGTSS